MSRARLVIVTGKGGVGRSTITGALARNAARSGERVLAIDASAGNGLALALGCDAAPTPGRQKKLGGPAPVTVLTLDTEAALDEYVRLHLKTPVSPRVLGPVARIFEYVATAAPAVREILTIGKIGHEVKHGPWDLVVVDGPATGHIVELLAAPGTFGELIGIGPLATEAAWLSELLADPAMSGLVAVTTAEELPVTETLDLLGRLAAQSSMSVTGLVVNRWPPPVSAEGTAEARRLRDQDGPHALLATAAVARAQMAEAERERLDAVNVSMLTVPDSDNPLETAVAALAKVGW